ncbi:S1/P1 nuclease [Pararhizobium sp. O133]|uniref:S1/P1 nuclease n=1 Tax=Pararhizobium sp. O133 TaxID=3449278 RepID=UPI003F685A3A
MLKLVLSALLLLATHGDACAWGREGHKVVAVIAQAHLTPEAKAAVMSILAAEGKTSMASVALWADDVRKLPIPRQPSHEVKLPLNHDGYDPAVSCKGNRCVLAAIDADIAVLRARDLPPAAQVAALKYLIHFIGDLHQPLHASADNGQEMMEIGGKVQKLHRVWDTEIIQAQNLRTASLAQEVEASPFPVDLSGSPTDWALEGRDIARDVIFPTLAGYERDSADGRIILPESYNKKNWPIVERRLKQAGYRLASLLNGIFSKSPRGF